MSQPADARPGLRERKKAKTRAAIQAHALRLFSIQGYQATTVEQIAEAAEVSPSTFFRYFPTKEEVVMHDRYDPLLLAAFHAQPRELTPVQALRRALAEVLGRLPADDLKLEQTRGRLIFTVPELRGRFMDQIADTIQILTEAIAERMGRDPSEFAVRNFAGALVGISLAAVNDLTGDPEADYLAAFDRGLEHLEAGLPLDPEPPARQ
ncbi:MAG TPA: TetR family transcriptional regulator [Solirubrobacteraceae bacterium]|nr:TetR family transcriptional regulator [Solirubrobacteraceae bacterium]